VKPTVFYGAPTGFAGMLASPNLPARDASPCAWCRPPARRCPPTWASASRQHFGVDIVDGIGSTEMLHIFLSNLPDKVRYGTTGWPVPGYDIELRGEDGGCRCPTASPATCTSTAHRPP
jgi:benzoate-CoA ligase